ncbi:hypothetical protein [Bradyrhizobium sp. LMTR 3]|uniref:hypothetical protein n=1 Tax=Bradyrhizobium sp. LMTR 3 TaxID=189873 RepID=UPI0008108C84|nr:hypothetical protein [Bradyrhizobium sp. LMTR 3]OCK55553.1 hypothetical protein LMTR3_12210 [Bradyrhizobium sp. LMTR 3]
MRFIVPKVDLRRQTSGGDTIEDETGNVVGQFFFSHGDRDRSVLLFGKYGASYRTHEECQAFADGVAAVLTHMTKVELK